MNDTRTSGSPLEPGQGSDPRVDQVLRAWRGEAPADGEASSELATWTDTFRSAGRRALETEPWTAPTDPPQPATRKRWRMPWSWVALAYLLPMVAGVIATWSGFQESHGCDGGICGLVLLFAAAGIGVGLGLGTLLLIVKGIFFSPPRPRAEGPPAMFTAPERIRVVEWILAGGGRLDATFHWGVTLQRLEAWERAYVNVGQATLQERLARQAQIALEEQLCKPGP